MHTQRRLAKIAAALALPAAAALLAPPAHANDEIKFDMVRSPALHASPYCAPLAKASVKIDSLGPVEEMTVSVEGLPPNTDFDFFVIQEPNAPFGMSWYQGDIETNAKGSATAKFVGRFSIETFIVAPGSVAAPAIHHNAVPDATLNPATGPIHTHHLGLWFNSPADAVKAGCPGAVTPFNGEHNAGVQVLNTSNYPALFGPLRLLKP